MSITTRDGALIEDREHNVDAHLSLSGGGEASLEADLQMKGRGHSTWGFPKKPFKLKLAESQSLMGMPANKNWVLLANYIDKSLLRNFTAFDLGERLGMEWTPHSKFVELTLNGQYLGSYQLAESVELSKARLDSDVLLEVDSRRSGAHVIETSRGTPFNVELSGTPDAMSLEQVRAKVQAAEDAIFAAASGSDFESRIDVDSFVDWYLVNELTKNKDAAGISSIFMHVRKDGRIAAGPLWDFDRAAGNDVSIDYSPIGWYLATHSDNPNGWWITRLMESSAFKAKLRDKWLAMKNSGKLDAWLGSITSQGEVLSGSAANNFSRWLILNRAVYPNPVYNVTYGAEVGFLRSWLNKRIDWMTGQFN
jgi:hypothetical protein